MRSCADALAAARERAAAGQDPGSVLVDHALADAGGLAALADPAADPDAAHMFGMFGWFRFEGLGEGADRGG
jgi:hypothetical protein